METSIYNNMQRFADLTKLLISTGNISRAKKCIDYAEKLFTSGNNEIKNAISNVYVFSITSFMELHNCSVKNLLPGSLKSEYSKQVNACGH
jgi:hypothetical protein